MEMWMEYWGDVWLAARYLNQNSYLSSSMFPILFLPATNKTPSPTGQSLWCPSPALPTLTDALVHVRVAGVEVSRRAGRQADAHLADVVPLQQDEQLG